MKPFLGDESIQADIIRKRREMQKAYVAPELPRAEPAEVIFPECVACDDPLYSCNRSPKHNMCSRCYEESEALVQISIKNGGSGFLSRDFFEAIVVAGCLGVIVGAVLGSLAWWIGSKL